MSQQSVRRTTYAAAGAMKLNASFTDLHLRLFDGNAYEVESREEDGFARTSFKEQLYVMRGVGDLFEDASTSIRSDREMSIAMLFDSRSSRLAEMEAIREESLGTARRAVDRALGRGAVSDSARAAPVPRFFGPGGTMSRDEAARRVASSARAELGRYSNFHRFASQAGVEINKKIVISTSCIVFVMIGVPIAIRFPRGGVNMVIVVSSFVISLYQIGLSNGEEWADRGLANPFWSMWAPSFVFLVMGDLPSVAHGTVDRGHPRQRVAGAVARSQEGGRRRGAAAQAGLGVTRRIRPRASTRLPVRTWSRSR